MLILPVVAILNCVSNLDSVDDTFTNGPQRVCATATFLTEIDLTFNIYNSNGARVLSAVCIAVHVCGASTFSFISSGIVAGEDSSLKCQQQRSMGYAQYRIYIFAYCCIA